ncbi:homing endonuclease associated repeat-containing protein [Halosimplex pelagicum]|uniref:HNH endonuclease n=1 Tax=Halosimplex pelagicum TaxID=869886 RepID=A0A7D5TBL3_9EURY|nr:HNH endonuclease [Halosimplex pelagicum]QLH83810.1 HNH endonuclease [Halosimplex pelagicum]
MDTAPPRDDLLAELRNFHEDIGRVPTVREMRNEGPYSPHYYKDKFGSWHDALRAADIQPTHGVRPDVDREELVTSLQEVDEKIERSPRRTDVDEHGEFPYILYDEEFGSFVHALEEAGISPDEKQYRFSSVETPPELRGSANIQKLREGGPTPGSELPQGRSMKDRERGVWKFRISSGAIEQPDPIYYLNGEHVPELVIRRFFKSNPHVLEHRDPHGIRMAIGEHKPSWKEIGFEVVDELVSEGAFPEASFANLIVVRVNASEMSQYCFERSIETLIDGGEIPDDNIDSSDKHPIWGFSEEQEMIWRDLSERDGILFATQQGTFTHYMSVRETVQDTDFMIDLWVEYEDGIRAGGIEEPQPYIVIGEEIREISVPETELAADLDVELSESAVQQLNEERLETFTNRFGNFTTYLRDRERSDTGSSTITLGADSDLQDVSEALLGFPTDELPLFAEESRLNEVDTQVRKAAFREGIYEIYSGCAICGKLFESPSGEHNLEAAHILPRADDGPDVLQNGLALCSRHHWAFDNGWFEIDETYEIEIQDHPNLAGHEEFLRFNGESLHLPEREGLHPHPQYIQERNRRQDE